MHGLSYLFIVASTLLIVQLISSNSMTYAVDLDRYWSFLTGDQQTPPVITDATCYHRCHWLSWFKIPR